jgi:CRP/FNR family transcriptional regulator, cyclic AMP receptor protein
MTTIHIFRNEQNLAAFQKGDVIFKHGDQGSSMYAIIDGRVEIRKSDAAVADLGPADVFGEMALLDGKPRSATAIAASDCTVAAIDSARFAHLVQETPYFAIRLLQIMAERIRHNLET